jgi:hypothetical protein
LQPSAENLGFAFRIHKSGWVTITRDGRTVTVLRGAAARDFGARIPGLASAEQQAVMARLTGNYRRGNERVASAHDRNRGE